MKVKINGLALALTAVCSAQPASVDHTLQRILQEANNRELVLIVAEPLPAATPPKGTTSIPEADQITEEEDDPGAAVPS
ncbi:hypothetical protein JST97_20885 [bacterium]|nr:hypothetical protein [bacterium]